ncbi:MAG: hypothetical protein VX519_05765 [Myxococcota bacterium]|nr:hypothetical protein [Myxococcota bacterium]
MLLACATHSMVAPPYDVMTDAPSAALAELFASTEPQALFEEAVNRRMQGDSQGAIDRLAWLEQQGHGDSRVLYELALAHESREDFSTAVAVYDLLLGRDASQSVQQDAGFRRALALLGLGTPQLAVEQLLALPGGEVLADTDRHTFDLGLGVAWMRSDKLDAGMELVISTLEATADSESIPWMRAMGWHALAFERLVRSQEIRVDRRPYRRAARNLSVRAGLIAEAERYLIEVVQLGEPTWIMVGMRDLGDAFIHTYEALNNSPVPNRLNPEQAELYREMMQERSQSVLAKGWKAYDQGLDIAGRFGLQTSRVGQELQTRRDAIPF